MNDYEKLDKEELVHILIQLSERHSYLAAEIKKMMDETSFGQLDLKKLKADWQAIVKKHKHDGFIHYWDMLALENELLPLIGSHFEQLIVQEDWIKVLDYGIFIWKQSYNLNGDDDGTVMTLVNIAELSLERAIHEIKDNRVWVKRALVKVLSTAQSKIALDWNSRFWLELSLELIENQSDEEKVEEVIQKLENASESGAFSDIYLMLRLRVSNATEEEKNQVAMENEVYFARRIKTLKATRNFGMLEELLLEKNKRVQGGAKTAIEHELILIYKNMGRIKETLEIYKKQMLREGEIYNFDYDALQALVVEIGDESYWQEISDCLKKQGDMEKFGEFLKVSGQKARLAEEFSQIKEVQIRETWALRFFHELTAQQQLEISGFLFKLFSEGMSEAGNPKRYESLARGVIEIARWTNQEQEANQVFKSWEEKYPRRSSLIRIVKDMKEKISSPRLKTVNLRDKYYYGIGKGY